MLKVAVFVLPDFKILSNTPRINVATFRNIIFRNVNRHLQYPGIELEKRYHEYVIVSFLNILIHTRNTYLRN